MVQNKSFQSLGTQPGRRVIKSHTVCRSYDALGLGLGSDHVMSETSSNSTRSMLLSPHHFIHKISIAIAFRRWLVCASGNNKYRPILSHVTSNHITLLRQNSFSLVWDEKLFASQDTCL